MVVHLIVSITKRQRAQGSRPAILAIGDIPIMVSAKEGQLLMKWALSLIVLVVGAYTLGGSSFAIEPFTAFLLGYSLDSVVGLVGDSLDKQADAQIAVFKQKTGLTTS
jgi:hypothetical protein